MAEIFLIRRFAAAEERPKHIRIYGVCYYGYNHLFRYALGSAAVVEERCFKWNDVGRYWHINVKDILRGVQKPDGSSIVEADITGAFLLELISNAEVPDEGCEKEVMDLTEM